MVTANKTQCTTPHLDATLSIIHHIVDNRYNTTTCASPQQIFVILVKSKGNVQHQATTKPQNSGKATTITQKHIQYININYFNKTMTFKLSLQYQFLVNT